jgi:hypothetical protein
MILPDSGSMLRPKQFNSIHSILGEVIKHRGLTGSIQRQEGLSSQQSWLV